MTILEVATDEHDRPWYLVEDIQRLLVTQADYWNERAAASFWNADTYRHTAITLRMLAASFDNLETITI